MKGDVYLRDMKNTKSVIMADIKVRMRTDESDVEVTPPRSIEEYGIRPTKTYS